MYVSLSTVSVGVHPKRRGDAASQPASQSCLSVCVCVCVCVCVGSRWYHEWYEDMCVRLCVCGEDGVTSGVCGCMCEHIHSRLECAKHWVFGLFGQVCVCLWGRGGGVVLG